MKLILLSLLLSNICFADTLGCGTQITKYDTYTINGHYNHDVTPAAMATFTPEDGNIIVFSFNNCQVTITDGNNKK